MSEHKFTSVTSKPHTQIAGDLADSIRDAIYAYSDRVPLALVIGVLTIVTAELIEASE